MNSWMSLLNHDCLTSEGSKMVRFLVKNASRVILAGIPTLDEVMALKKVWEADNSALLTTTDRIRLVSLKDKFSWQVRQLILHRLVVDDLLQYELDQLSDGTEALALMGELEEFLHETERQVLVIQNVCRPQVDYEVLAA